MPVAALLQSQPAIQRDGTSLEAGCYDDGNWVRFIRKGTPASIGGYRFMCQTSPALNFIQTKITQDGNAEFSIEEYQLFPASKLEVRRKEGDAGSKSLTISGLSAGSLKSETLVIAAGSKMVTDNSYSSIASIKLTDKSSLDSFEFFLSDLSKDTPPGGFKYKPVSAIIVPSPTLDNKWILITGHAPTNIFGEKARTFDSLIYFTIIDSITGMVDTQPFNLFFSANNSVNIPQSFSDENASWCLDTFTANNTIYLIAVPVETGKSVDGSRPAYPIMSFDLKKLDKDAPSKRLEIISKSKGFTLDTVGESDRIYTSGGFLCLFPYLVVYDYGIWKDNKAIARPGYLVVSRDSLKPEDGSSFAKENTVSSTHVVYAASVRGGGQSPSALIWTLDSLVRMYLANANQSIFAFDFIAGNISIISNKSVVEDEGLFYWAGNDRFFVYNGSVQGLENNHCLNYFFENLDYDFKGKIWGTKVGRKDEIWWHFPNKNLPGYHNECNAYVIYNTKFKTWYSGYFPVTTFDSDSFDISKPIETSQGRICGVSTADFHFPIWFESRPTSINVGESNDDRSYKGYLHENGYDQTLDVINYEYNPLGKIDRQYFPVPYTHRIHSFFETNLFSLVSNSLEGKFQGDQNWTKVKFIESDQLGNCDLFIDMKTKTYSQDPEFFINNRVDGLTQVVMPDYQSVCRSQNFAGSVTTYNALIDGNRSKDEVAVFQTSQSISVSGGWNSDGAKFKIVGTYMNQQAEEEITLETTGSNQYSHCFAKTRSLFDSVEDVIISEVSKKKSWFSVGNTYPSIGQWINQQNSVIDLQQTRSRNFITPIKIQGRFYSIRYQSYGYGGWYQMGMPLIHYEPGISRV